MRFELGKYYRHVQDIRIHVCGICDTEVSGRCLIAEDQEGNLSPIDESNDRLAINFHEISREEFLDGIKRDVKINSGQQTVVKKDDWRDNPVSPAQKRFIERIYKIVKGVPRFTGHTKQEAYVFIEKWKDAFYTEMNHRTAKGKMQKKGEE